MTFYIGRRLAYDGALCTVRYFGPLKGLKGEWVGVEWDNDTRGKHGGQHQREQIFQCLSPSATAASFIRPSRKPDSNRTVLEAIKHKYAASININGDNGSIKQESIEISGKTVEEVGFEKIQQQISQLSALKVVLVDGLNVIGVARDTSGVTKAQAELAATCPNISELDVGWNAVEQWQDVADICEPLDKLRILKASGLRLRSFEADFLRDGTSPFKSINELHLSECLLRPQEILQLLSFRGKPLFPSLKTLWLSQNELTAFEAHSLTLELDSVTTVVLENNKITSLSPLSSVFASFPKLQRLSLQGNAISSIGSEVANARFDSLEFLNLAENQINSFSFLDALPKLFPSLTSLRISKNPLYDQTDPAAASQTTTSPSDSTYYLTLARLPSLQTLNYTTITPRDREEGEIYYLSVAEKDIRTILSSSPSSALSLAEEKYPLYSSLCAKYDRPNILSTPAPTKPQQPSQISSYAPGTLGARLITATFYIPPTTQSNPPHTSENNSQQPYTFTRPLPPSLQVYTLKSLLSKHFGLAPLQFRLIYETGELDPVMETTTKLGRGKEDWDVWGEWDVDVLPETTHTTNMDINAYPETEPEKRVIKKGHGMMVFFFEMGSGGGLGRLKFWMG